MFNVSSVPRQVDETRRQSAVDANKSAFLAAVNTSIAATRARDGGTFAAPSAGAPTAAANNAAPPPLSVRGPLVAGQPAPAEPQPISRSNTSGPLVGPRPEPAASATASLRNIFEIAANNSRARLQSESAGAEAMPAEPGQANSLPLAPAASAPPNQPQQGTSALQFGPMQLGQVQFSALPTDTSPAQPPPSSRSASADIYAAIGNALTAAQQQRPISQIRAEDLRRAQEDRPIFQIMQKDLQDSMADLIIPTGELEKLREALTSEGGTIDQESEAAVLERANALLQQKYQNIVNDFSARIAQKGPPSGVGNATAAAASARGGPPDTPAAMASARVFEALGDTRRVSVALSPKLGGIKG